MYVCMCVNALKDILKMERSVKVLKHRNVCLLFMLENFLILTEQNSPLPVLSNVLFILDVDECSSRQHGCDNNAQCINTPGTFVCKCNSGFSANGTFCKGK